jgi:hypothetical protein
MTTHVALIQAGAAGLSMEELEVITIVLSSSDMSLCIAIEYHIYPPCLYTIGTI